MRIWIASKTLLSSTRMLLKQPLLQCILERMWRKSQNMCVFWLLCVVENRRRKIYSFMQDQ